MQTLPYLIDLSWIFCRCYDVKNPIPLKIEVKYQGNELKYYSRDDSVIDKLEPLANNAMKALGGSSNRRQLRASLYGQF